MKKGIIVRIIVDKEAVTKDLITAWFTTFTVFNPIKMTMSDYRKGKSYKYNRELFLDHTINSQDNNSISSSQLTNGDENISITSGSYADNISWLTLSINEASTKNLLTRLIEDLRKFVGYYGCIVGFVHSSFDNFMQNNEDIDYFTMYGGDLSKATLKAHSVFKDKKAIDTEENPGHSHFGHGIWFGSAWLMWFGPKYYEFIPRVVIAQQDYVYSNNPINQDIIEVQLYKDIENYDSPVNRQIQARFRNLLGIDQLAHGLPEKGQFNQIDPTYEVLTDGDHKYLVSYLDAQGDLTTKSTSIRQVKSNIK